MRRRSSKASFLNKQQLSVPLEEGKKIEIESCDSDLGCLCKPRVLCVDDNAFNIEVLVQLLQSQHKIFPDLANDGLEAVKLFREGL